MPHVLIEYPNGLEKEVAIVDLMGAAHQGAVDSGLFPIEADIKTRATALIDYQVGRTSSTFIHLTIRLLSGRTDEQKRQLTGCVLTRIRQLKSSVNVVTVEAVDMNRSAYAKDVLQ